MARRLALILGLGPAALLGGALFSQYVGGLAPCEMCIWQRWPHGIAIALAALGFLTGPNLAGRAALRLGALTLLIGAGIGAFHAGVELGYWEGPTSCSGGVPTGLSPAELMERLQNASLIRCDEVPWSFLGISMAGWNAILSLGLAAVWWIGARLYKRGFR